MSHADGKLFEALADHVCRDLLWALLDSDQDLTQSQLCKQLSIKSGLASKRMGVLEDLGLVERPSPHASYSVVFPSETRSLLVDGSQLVTSALKRRYEESDAHRRELLKKGMDGGHLRDRAKEGTA
jgi:MarR family protein